MNCSLKNPLIIIGEDLEEMNLNCTLNTPLIIIGEDWEEMNLNERRALVAHTKLAGGTMYVMYAIVLNSLQSPDKRKPFTALFSPGWGSGWAGHLNFCVRVPRQGEG